MSRAQLTSTVEQSSGGVVAPFLAGKNAIINGDFRINQRNFSSTGSGTTYGFDRWYMGTDYILCTYSAQTFTAGSAPVAGYEAINYAQVVAGGQSASSSYCSLEQRIEDVRTFANSTVTVSFWAKASSGTPNIGASIIQNFGSGGSSDVNTIGTVVGSTATATAISTSWVRYSFNVAVPTISGKTIGTGSYLRLVIVFSAGSNFAGILSQSVGLQNNTFSVWGVQVERGPVATPFTTASNTLQGELALCQRYYWQSNQTNTAYTTTAYATALSSTQADALFNLPVPMRVPPTTFTYSVVVLQQYAGASQYNVTAASAGANDASKASVRFTVASGLSTGTIYNVTSNSTTTNYVAFSAEL